MTNKEALQLIIDTFNQYANKPDDIGLFFKFCEAHEQLEKDLEELEQYRKVMCKPVLDLMRDLEILEILKKHLYYEDTTDLETSVISKENYNITIFKALYEEDFNKIKEWLDK